MMATPLRLPLRRPALLAALSLVAIAAIALYFAGRSGDDDGAAPPASPGTGPAESLLVLAEFSRAADEIFVAPAGDPADRTAIATVDHAPGWGINPAAEMAGSLAAYTVLPAGALPQRDSPAELWLLDVASGERTRLARDADLLAAPVLAPDGTAVVYRSTDGTEQRLVRVDLASRARRVLHTARTDFGVFPVATTPGGDLLFSEISTAGTDLHAVSLHGPGAGGPRHVLHASPYIARDWRLAPDGGTLSYLAPEPLAERVVHRLHVATLETGGASKQSAPLVGEAATSEQYGAVWRPDGAAITIGLEAVAGPAAAVTLPLDDTASPAYLAAPEAGFDVPLGWSPDGRMLAVRSFDGHNSADPGREQLTVIELAGARRAIPSRSQLLFLGWWTRG